jgi:heme/copper-type cytochrome/quinol oxidase subunit 2
MNVDDRGQIMLLASLVVCICLILLAICLISVREAETAESLWQGDEALENLIWAQEIGLEHVARAIGNYSWDNREHLKEDFRNGADRLTDGIFRNLRARGIAFTYEYNATIAAQYAAGSVEPTLANLGGVLLRKSGNETRVCGCAYDAAITDGSARYSVTRIVTWGLSSYFGNFS